MKTANYQFFDLLNIFYSRNRLSELIWKRYLYRRNLFEKFAIISPQYLRQNLTAL